MKKFNKVLTVAMFGVVGLSAGVVRAEEVKSNLCGAFCTWCEEAYEGKFECQAAFCDSDQACHENSQAYLVCLHNASACAGIEVEGDGCLEEYQNWQGCLEAHPICGDGFIRNAEQCDDGNQVDGDGCSATCQLE